VQNLVKNLFVCLKAGRLILTNLNKRGYIKLCRSNFKLENHLSTCLKVQKYQGKFSEV